eukprot:3707383-Amphidinium_carterae.1
MQRGRGPYREPRRADALHPHLDSSPENPNDYWGDSLDSSNDSEGTYATPQFTNDTPTWEEDLTWEQGDQEEERRERDEVASVSPEDVRQLPRPSV